MHDRAEHLIAQLRLEPHPEGGCYRQIFKSSAQRDGRAALTAIYFLLAAGQHSRWHRVASDEIWAHIEGAAIDLWTFDDRAVARETLAPLVDGSPVIVVPRSVWQAAEVRGDYALVACFVAPGFEFEDFTLMADDADARERLRLTDPELLRLV